MSTTAQPSRRPIYLILFAALAAAVGNGISLIAFPWLVLQHNGSAFDASIVAGAASLPLLFSTLIAGTAVDYLGRRRVSIISDALSATTVAAVPVLAIMFGHASITVGVLAVLAALGALFDPAGITARESMFPRPPRAPLAYAACPLGFMLVGPLTDATGLRMTFLVLAIPMIVIGLVSLRLSSLRELDESSGPDPGPT